MLYKEGDVGVGDGVVVVGEVVGDGWEILK
jgi:hypothetical protein